MPSHASLQTQVAQLFAQRLNVDVPSIETDVIETGLVDSLMFVELLAQLEEVFGVSVALEDLELDNFRTIARIARYLAGKGSALENHDRHGEAGLVSDAQVQTAHAATLGLQRGAA